MTDYSKYRRIGMFMKFGERKYIAAIVLMVIGSFLLASLPLTVGFMVDRFSEHAEDGNYDILLNDLTTAFAVIGLMVAGWYVAYSKGKAMIIRNVSSALIRDTLARKTDRLPASYLTERPEGDMAAMIANDVPAIFRMVTYDIPGAIVQLFIVITMIVLMVCSNFYLACVYMVLFIVSFSVTRYIGRRMMDDLKARQESLGELNGYFGDVITNHSLVKIYRLERMVFGKFREIDDKHNKSFVRTMSAFGYVGPISRIIDNSGYILTAIIGSVMIMRGMITTGMFLAFISYATVIGGPMVSFSENLNRIEDSSAAYDRLLEFIDEEEIYDDSGFEPVDTSAVDGGITFENVSFGYVPDKKVLKDFSVTIDPGMTVAVIGREGSGKSTMSELLMGFRIPSEGSICIDGRDIATMKRSDLRKIVGLSGQDPWIYETTVLDNLSVTEPRERIVEVSRMSTLDSYVNCLPKGYDTVIGGRGHGLSSGEKQILAITRMVLYGTKIMIFDESSSEMDPVTRDRVYRGILPLIEDRTVIIVANTASSVINADRVLFMSEGTVADYGSHEELLDRNQAYAEMFRSMTV